MAALSLACSDHFVVCLFPCSLSEYADLHGQLPERRVWGVLIDLLKVCYVL